MKQPLHARLLLSPTLGFLLTAREYGQGGILVSGEAAMFTAQEARIFLKPFMPDSVIGVMTTNNWC